MKLNDLINWNIVDGIGIIEINSGPHNRIENPEFIKLNKFK